MSQPTPEKLNIVTWNINRNSNIQKKVEDLEKQLIPHVIFLQETCIDVKGKIEIEGWRAFYTQYSSNQKGAAILVKDAKNLEFKLYSQEADRNGRYIVVRCRLLGQPYTLVSVYNHKDDITTLDLLSPYLQKMTVGTLVIGGDFNTTFSRHDRETSLHTAIQRCETTQRTSQHKNIKRCVDRLLKNVQVVDVFRRKNGYGRLDDQCFTFIQEKGQTKIKSRLDYFFMPEEYICSVKNCQVLQVHDVDSNDHRPLLLQMDPKPLEKESKIKVHEWKANSWKYISAVEIVAAIQSLQLRNIERRHDEVAKYKKFTAKKLDDLKRSYNEMIENVKLTNSLQSFNSPEVVNQYYFFNVKYLILANILTWRLKDWDPLVQNKRKQTQRQNLTERQLSLRCTVNGPTEVCWSHLENCIKKTLQDHPCVEDFNILKHMLQKAADKKIIKLCEGCPLTHTLRKLLRPQKVYTDTEDSDTEGYEPSKRFHSVNSRNVLNTNEE